MKPPSNRVWVRSDRNLAQRGRSGLLAGAVRSSVDINPSAARSHQCRCRGTLAAAVPCVAAELDPLRSRDMDQPPGRVTIIA